jgi:RNA polymerase sigma-70 factor (ECF subfamily)
MDTMARKARHTDGGQAADAGRRTARDRALYERLARRFYAGVYNYLCWISRDTALAEDLTQETFMRVWQNLPEVRSERAVKVWVYRVARNQYLQHRRQGGLKTVALEDCAEAADSRTPGPELALERRDLCQAVRAAVDELPDACREVIVLHNLEGFPLAQVADVLQVPIGTVKSRRGRAFQMLRELLQEVAR